MEISDFRQTQDGSLTFQHREWSVDVEFNNDNLTLTFSHDGERQGRVAFDNKEIQILSSSLGTFFVDGKRGKDFNYDTSSLCSPQLPQLRLNTTNWGDPYAQGIRFVFSDDFENYSLENLYFDLEQSDAKQLFTHILKKYSKNFI